MIWHYGFQVFLFVSGLIVAIVYNSDIREILLFMKDSLCERDSSDGILKASGKSISALVLVILFVSISLYICRQGYVGAEDFKPNQKELLKVIIDTIQYLILFLYGIKLMGKAKVSAVASAIFGKVAGNGTDAANGNGNGGSATNPTGNNGGSNQTPANNNPQEPPIP